MISMGCVLYRLDHKKIILTIKLGNLYMAKKVSLKLSNFETDTRTPKVAFVWCQESMSKWIQLQHS